MANKKAKKIKRRQLTCKVAIEISRSEFSLIIVDKKDDGRSEVRGYRSQWLQQAAGLNHEQGGRGARSSIGTYRGTAIPRGGIRTSSAFERLLCDACDRRRNGKK